MKVIKNFRNDSSKHELFSYIILRSFEKSGSIVLLAVAFTIFQRALFNKFLFIIIKLLRTCKNNSSVTFFGIVIKG